ncbi:MAG: hypothetical protein JJE45_08330 [Prolixibacteraceae bacterium]|nr:hypothetical protein [Prolixibacteraceae bacterium]
MYSKKNFKSSKLESNDFESGSKRTKKDKSSKRPLSIYDSFEEEEDS